MVFLIMNSIDILEGIKMLFYDHDKFCREAPRRCNRSAMTSSQRNDEVKGYWNDGYDTNLESSLLFKVKQFDEEGRRKISSSSKFVLREEGPGSIAKVSMIMM